jgi:Glycosyl hydrolases family 35/Glycosyl hydrolases family 2, sugar binding domain/Beta-galactosidase, galactose-binding domain
MQKKIVSRFAMVVIGAAAIIFTKHGFAEEQNTVGVTFSQPDRIRYDNHSLIINGKPVFIFSGELHYFRCPRELWKDRMQKMKDAGLNCVDTYLAWNLHEPEEPSNPDDFSKLRDMDEISDFIQTAQDLGLYVMIRPGPYICAEVDRGGLPGWLMKYRPEGLRLGQFLRSNSPEMLAWDRHWLTAAAKVVKPHLITNVPKGSTGVILWQLENEYDYTGAGLSSDVRTDVLRELAQASLDSGIDVPLFTCETMDQAFRDDPVLRAHVFDTVNKYPNYDMTPLVDDVAVRAQYQPEAFRGVTELQGGWFSQIGGTLSGGHNAAQITQVTLTAIERGCTMINYYMFYGGSNFGYSAARTVTQSYDYNAPLREWGGMGDRYYAVKAIGQMLQEHGQQLINSEPVELKIEGDHRDVSIYLRQSEDGSQFYFVRNSQEHESRSGTAKVRPKDGAKQELTYNLGSFEAKVLYVPPGTDDLADGEWLPKPVEATNVVQPMPEAVPVHVASIVAEEPADNWRSVPTGKHLEFAGVFDQRYVYYRVNFNLSAEDISTPLAFFVFSDGGGGSLAARVNGTEVPIVRDAFIPLDDCVHEGNNSAEILFENLGCHRFGPVIEDKQGITRISLVPQAARGHALEEWRMKLVPADTPAAELAEVRADFDDGQWQSVRLTEPAAATPAGKSAVYRSSFSVSQDQLANGMVLTFPVIDDSGILYVNGREAGRANDWSQPWKFDVTDYLHAGSNLIALLVHNDWGDGGPQQGCRVEPIGRPLDDLQVVSATRVEEEPLDADQHRRLLTRYKMEFQLPGTPAALSVPWKLHLEADANAFVTLNGHLLGRYWAAGPQRDFWLPECWLNFGPDAKNVLELQARPTSDGPVGKIIKQVGVRPYSQSTDATSSIR